MQKIEYSRRNFLKLASLAAAGAASLSCQWEAASVAKSQSDNETKDHIASILEGPVANPEEAIQRLWEGNQRFVQNQMQYPNQGSVRRQEVVSAQRPFAIIFGCIDSRVPPEIIFDRGIGDLLVVRTAGHVLDDVTLGSIEYGVKELGIPLIMVLGHEKCGAVKATIEAIESNTTPEGKIAVLTEKIRPAADAAKDMEGDILHNAVYQNVILTAGSLLQSTIIEEAIARFELVIYGARYSLETGGVEALWKMP